MKKEFRIYKPNKNNNGAASKWQLSSKKSEHGITTMLFLTMGSQTGIDSNGNAAFGWTDESKNIIMKLGILDIGELLSVLRGIKSYVGESNNREDGKGLYHETEKGNSVLKFYCCPPDQYSSTKYYKIVASQKRGNQTIKCYHTISIAEAQILFSLLEKAVIEIHGW